MKATKVNSIRFYLTKEECMRDDVEILAEYRIDNSNPSKGNCFVDYWINIKDYGFRSHIMGIWLNVTKENIVSKMKLHLTRGIDGFIEDYEREIEILENAQIED